MLELHREVAILGMGRIIDRPWVVAGQIAVRNVCELTLAFDHRVCEDAPPAGSESAGSGRGSTVALVPLTAGSMPALTPCPCRLGLRAKRL